VITLVVTWLVLGPGRRLVRTIAAPVVLIVAPWALAAVSERLYFSPAKVPWPFALAISVALISSIVRTCGLRVTVVASESVTKPQYSILALLAATTLVAVTIGGLELLRPTIASPSVELTDLRAWLVGVEREATFGRLELVRGLVPTPATVRQFVLAAAVACCAVGALATVLRPGAIWLRLAVLTILIPSLAAYLAHLAGDGNTLGTNARELTVAFAAVAGLVAISVLPLRLFGFRLQRTVVSSPKFHVGSIRGSRMPPAECQVEDLFLNPAHTECGPTLP
jgi:hypothetical protein